MSEFEKKKRKIIPGIFGLRIPVWRNISSRMWADWTFHSTLARLSPINAFWFTCPTTPLQKLQMFPYPDSAKKFSIPLLCKVSIGVRRFETSYLRRMNPCIISLAWDGDIIIFSQYLPLKREQEIGIENVKRKGGLGFLGGGRQPWAS